jgi:CBS domain-containing protein
MVAVSESLFDLTARDLMTRSVVRLSGDLSLREAARILCQNQIGGAPVVDGRGKCVGMLSAVDFLRLAEKPAEPAKPHPGAWPAASPPRRTCSFQTEMPDGHGHEASHYDLPAGVCVIQRNEKGPLGEDRIVRSEIHSVPVDWQMVEVDKLPTDKVSDFMSHDPVTAGPETPIRALARMMIDAHVHRVVVVDEQGSPIGVVSATDVLAAIAYAD